MKTIFFIACLFSSFNLLANHNETSTHSSTLSAAKSALLNPATYIPTIGALIYALGDFDEDTSDWATDKHPVFGSYNKAQSYSYDLMYAVGVASLLFCSTSSCQNDANCWETRSKRLGLTAISAINANLVTEGLKHTVDREKPNQAGGHTSFPSGHSATAFSFARAAAHCIDTYSMNDYLKTGLKLASTASASLVAWGRVEADRHFPSDVLAGAAIGSFITDFAFNLFDAKPATESFAFQLNVAPTFSYAHLKYEF